MIRQGIPLRRAVACAFAVLVALPAAAAAQEQGAHSDNMRFVKNIPYEARNQTPNYGTDMEFARIGGRDYAVAGSEENGMRIIDVSRPEKAKVVGTYDCDILQGDVQVFRQKQRKGRVYATYTADADGNPDSACYREAEARGFDAVDGDRGRQGTFVVDITDPRRPRTASFVEVEQGSHNQTVHPSGNYLYNSNADLITSLQPAIEVIDISNLAAPHKTGELALPTRPGLGTESHDISFDAKGDRAYSAALSQGVVIDSSKPARPTIVSSFVDPAVNVWHQAEPVKVGSREFLIVEDEFAGAAGGPVCPSGGFHVYDITGDREKAPVKVGAWNIDEVRVTSSVTNTCTAHVFDVHPAQDLLTVAYYNGGVRVVDISSLAGIGLGKTDLVGAGMREVGFYRHADADTWSAKTPRIAKDGSFYLYGNDIARGFDVYRFDGKGRTSKRDGRWLSPAQARREALKLPDVKLPLGLAAGSAKAARR
ncbi:MAG TPA: hypothetical protein VFY44_12270, partial [Thermoleophilaceae bacterium]|nr:hypothetical protein [Thermoleophilaceae bacterium]